MNRFFKLESKEGKIERIKIGVSGSAAGYTKEAEKKAEEVGYWIAKNKLVLVTGDTTGIPLAAARGAKKAGGFTVGISPASSFKEHIRKYRLPFRYSDFSMYTGFGYAGRNLLFVRATDAMIIIAGRIGTLNEFTIAFEDKKPIGILLDSGGMSDEMTHILNVAKRGRAGIIMDTDPRRLVDKVAVAARNENKTIRGDERG